MSRLKLVAVLAVVTALGGCSPSPTWAAKLTPTGLPQFVDTDCETLGVEWMQVQATDDNGVVDDEDPVIWKIEFASPTQLKEITVGQKPAGAQEKVAWQPPKGDQDLVMAVQRKNGVPTRVEFTLDALKDGKVRYQDEYISADEFAKKRVDCQKA